MTDNVEAPKKTIEEICNAFEMETVCAFGSYSPYKASRIGCCKVVKVKFKDLVLAMVVYLSHYSDQPNYRIAFKCPKCGETIPISDKDVPKEIVSLLDTPEARERLLNNFCNVGSDKSRIIEIE
jgi:hypothetical protein